MSSTSDQIIEYINTLNRDRETIKKNTIEMSIYSGGGITLNEAKMSSHKERKIAYNIINDKLKMQSGDTTQYF